MPGQASVCVMSPVMTIFEPHAKTRDEHLHLLGRGILCLVQDDEAVVQGSTAHECERSDLDHPFGEELIGTHWVHHVEERIVERTNVGINLLGERSGQKAEVLPRSYHRTREQDAPDLLAIERSDPPWPWQDRSYPLPAGPIPKVMVFVRI